MVVRPAFIVDNFELTIHIYIFKMIGALLGEIAICGLWAAGYVVYGAAALYIYAKSIEPSPVPG